MPIELAPSKTSRPQRITLSRRYNLSPTSSVVSYLKAQENVQAGPLLPPPFLKMKKCHMPFWELIIKARARDEWNSAHDMINAAIAAKLCYMIGEEFEMLEAEGLIILKGAGKIPVKATKGTPKEKLIENPRFESIILMTDAVMRLFRYLLIQPAHSAKTFERAKRRTLEKMTSDAQESLKKEVESQNTAPKAHKNASESSLNSLLG